MFQEIDKFVGYFRMWIIVISFSVPFFFLLIILTTFDNQATAAAAAQREFQLVVFGATGFTGKLAVAYLAKQYGTSVKWAIAGRRRDALLKVASSDDLHDPL